MHSDEGRVGEWMQTFSGKKFWPLSPRPGDFFIEDIVHALSLVCRYGGQCSKFYSVAEHCLWVSEEAGPKYALEALMHDLGEAFIGDLVRPLKNALPEYRDVEKRIEVAAAQQFGLVYPWPLEVKRADEAVLMAEAEVLMPNKPEEWVFMPGTVRAKGTVRGLDSKTARKEFLKRFMDLCFVRHTIG